jgi:hypothetical protein
MTVYHAAHRFNPSRMQIMPASTTGDKALYDRAIEILKAPDPKQIRIEPWRTSMAKANADAKRKDMKAAEKKLAAKGVVPPKHQVLTSKTPKLASASDFVPPKPPWPTIPGTVSKTAASDISVGNLVEGVDSDPDAVVQSSHDVESIASTQPRSSTMNSPFPQAAAEKTPAEAKAAQKAHAAKLLQDEKDRKAKLKAETDKKKADEKAAADKLKAEAKEKAAKEKAEAKAKADAEKANKPPRERTYVGSMLTLAEKVAAGAYTKGANGQLRSNDELAVALESIPAKKMVAFLMEVLGLTTNPYPQLNYGQQSMNLRNRLRGVLKAGGIVLTPPVKAVAEKKEGDKVVKEAVAGVPAVIKPVTIDTIKALRDEGNWTSDPEAAAKEKAKADKAEAAKTVAA